MKTRYYFLIALTILLSSFRNVTNQKSDFIGTYGNPSKNETGIRLKLNEDQSFLYEDYSNSENPLIIKGEWIVLKNKATLIVYEKPNGFATRWSLDKEGEAIKGRSKLCWYRLCKINN